MEITTPSFHSHINGGKRFKSSSVTHFLNTKSEREWRERERERMNAT